MNTILIVDDEFDITEAVTLILRTEGYQVDTCANGREALAYLNDIKRAKPALVLLDVMMPFVSGLEVLRAMRKETALAQVPVVLMSAATPTVKQKDYGWTHFLKKPFNLDCLLKLVSEHAEPSTSESRSFA